MVLKRTVHKVHPPFLDVFGETNPPFFLQERRAKCIVSMAGKQTYLFDKSDPENEDAKKKYTFDYSYWSCDETDSHFASQEQVFADLGHEVLQSSFDGYNTCVFAYGQTGSGKSYTMSGYGITFFNTTHL